MDGIGVLTIQEVYGSFKTHHFVTMCLVDNKSSQIVFISCSAKHVSPLGFRKKGLRTYD